jgi:hypothetical protein
VNDLDFKLQWHSPEFCWACVVMRDGEPWYLDGALVGLGATPAAAVAEWTELAEYLVIYGQNFLCDSPLSLEDRKWLFNMIDLGSAQSNEMFVALHQAEQAEP